jgi:hypothetical protein
MVTAGILLVRLAGRTFLFVDVRYYGGPTDYAYFQNA